MNYLVMSGLAVAVWLFGSYLTPSPKAVLFFNSDVIKAFRKAAYNAGRSSVLDDEECPYCKVCQSWHYLDPDSVWRPCETIKRDFKTAQLMITRPLHPFSHPASPSLTHEYITDYWPVDEASDYLTAATARIERMAEQFYREGQP